VIGQPGTGCGGDLLRGARPQRWPPSCRPLRGTTQPDADTRPPGNAQRHRRRQVGREVLDQRGQLTGALDRDLVAAVEELEPRSPNRRDHALGQGLRREDGVVAAADHDCGRRHPGQAIGERGPGDQLDRTAEGDQRHGRRVDTASVQHLLGDRLGGVHPRDLRHPCSVALAAEPVREQLGRQRQRDRRAARHQHLSCHSVGMSARDVLHELAGHAEPDRHEPPRSRRVGDGDGVVGDLVEGVPAVGTTRVTVPPQVEGDQAQAGRIETLDGLIEVPAGAGPAVHEQHVRRSVTHDPVGDLHVIG
jgi:hypothetical protein